MVLYDSDKAAPGKGVFPIYAYRIADGVERHVVARSEAERPVRLRSGTAPLITIAPAPSPSPLDARGARPVLREEIQEEQVYGAAGVVAFLSDVRKSNSAGGLLGGQITQQHFGHHRSRLWLDRGHRRRGQPNFLVWRCA